MPTQASQVNPVTSQRAMFSKTSDSRRKRQSRRKSNQIFGGISGHIERRGVNQAYLKKTLKIHQPDVSNLLRGKIRV